ncbi:MAG: hypothetical protein ACXAD7_03015 [Candidatus Kariarchaeaceae archaeon]|jgi:hypothetical protein
MSTTVSNTSGVHPPGRYLNNEDDMILMKIGDIDYKDNNSDEVNFDEWLMSLMNELKTDPDYPQEVRKSDFNQNEPANHEKLLKLTTSLSLVRNLLYENYKSN